jgi:hypothetical protein
VSLLGEAATKAFNTPVGCIKLPVPVGVPIGTVTLLCSYQYVGINVWFVRASLDLLIQVSHTVSIDVAAHSGWVSMMRPGYIATGLWSVV